jgi:acyl-coenzyme A synthetase/AMP-(fatty) acid ligase
MLPRHAGTHKVPATIRFVPAIEVAASGKLARLNA